MRTYEGTIPGPTLRCRSGDVLAIRLINDLPPNRDVPAEHVPPGAVGADSRGFGGGHPAGAQARIASWTAAAPPPAADARGDDGQGDARLPVLRDALPALSRRSGQGDRVHQGVGHQGRRAVAVAALPGLADGRGGLGEAALREEPVVPRKEPA